jgi:uncharacterized protein YndB with AHSA1/START domain
MRVLKTLLYVVGGLLAALVVVGLLLPRSAHVERSIEVAASPATVYALVDGFGRFNEWSPWAELDPNTRYTYSGPERGVGARMEWTSDDPDVGSGMQEVVSTDPGRSVTSRLAFGGQDPATTTMTLVPQDAGTRVTWAFDSDFGWNLLGRYFGLLFDGFIGADYEKGLAKLKALAEREEAARGAEPAVDQAPAAGPTGQDTPVPPSPQ